MEEHEVEQSLDEFTLHAKADENADAGQEETELEETPLGVPFGRFGITVLLNILQYMVLLGLSLVVLIIIRVFMPADMLP